MTDVKVSLQTVLPRKLAAVRRQVPIGGVAAAWQPALDQVWEFLRRHPGLRADGHNVFLYHHAPSPNASIEADFGVEVIREFDPGGEVYATETPAGKAAVAVHVGSYAHLHRAHSAIHAWSAANSVTLAGKSWEIYGDWVADESKLQTTVAYLVT